MEVNLSELIRIHFAVYSLLKRTPWIIDWEEEVLQNNTIQVLDDTDDHTHKKATSELR